MLFSSPVFLFLFLPLVLGVYFVLWLAARGAPLWRCRIANAWLLVASLFFYAWGEQEIVLVMLASIAGNFGLGLWVDRARARGGGRGVVALALVFNLGLLVFYKYASFLVANWNGLFGEPGAPALDWEPIALPIGISFFTFQALSYVVDVYRRHGPAQTNPVSFATYIALFPQLVAGPIVRYRDVAAQLAARTIRGTDFSAGVRRFAIGLCKKMLVANTVALPADRIFALPESELSPALAWTGVVCYTLQIYFDFSGYSDMAIGLGRMFGFRFLENFRWPYVARSITEFWRRWHISLSTWFRDYLYVPLGGNRRGRARTYANLVTVFFLCGLWHGASWSFVVWGLFHGAFLVVERVGPGRALARLPRPLAHAYVVLVVMVGWVFFRASTLEHAAGYLGAMAGLASAGASPATLPVAAYVDRVELLAIALGVVGSVPWAPALGAWCERLRARGRFALDGAFAVAADAALAVGLVGSAMLLSADTYNPFIYFRF